MVATKESRDAYVTKKKAQLDRLNARYAENVFGAFRDSLRAYKSHF